MDTTSGQAQGAPPGAPPGAPGAPQGPPPGVGGGMGFKIHGPLVIGTTCLLLTLCLGAVGGRLAARRMQKVRLGDDDYLAILSLFIFIALAITQFLSAHYGLIMPTDRAPSPELINAATRNGVASQITYALLTTAVKACVLMLYRRIFSLRQIWFRIAWWAMMAFAIVYCAVLIPGQIIGNSHPSNVTGPATARMGFLNALIDFLILLLPIYPVWTLQMSSKRKMAVTGLFGLGIIAVAVSIARAVILLSPNFLSTGLPAFTIWSTTEPAVGLMCACLPCLRPLFTKTYAKISALRGPRVNTQGLTLGSRDVVIGFFKEEASTTTTTSKSGASSVSAVVVSPTASTCTQDSKGYGQVAAYIEEKAASEDV
ncbi:hypothetical protein MMC28_003572 [Mycoblastus sanguinarius]|nr:hypothetical protein [Mycoblastus sanguinarius]